MLDTVDLAKHVRAEHVWMNLRLSMTTVVIEPNGKIEKNVAPLRTRRKQVATWHIFNDSDEERNVAVKNFRLKATEQEARDVGEPFRDGVNVPAHQSRYIRGIAEAPPATDDKPLVYKYDIEVKGAESPRIEGLDPEYEIWP